MEFLWLVGGVLVGGVVMFFVARNNQKKFNEALNIDPKMKAKEVLAELKRRLASKI